MIKDTGRNVSQMRVLATGTTKPQQQNGENKVLINNDGTKYTFVYSNYCPFIHNMQVYSDTWEWGCNGEICLSTITKIYGTTITIIIAEVVCALLVLRFFQSIIQCIKK